MPNHGAITGLPDDLVVEVPAIVNQKGIQPIRVGSLPPKVMLEQIIPDWLDTERELLAFKTGDRSMLLQGVLNNHQTKTYNEAVAVLDELLNLPEVKAAEDWARSQGLKEMGSDTWLENERSIRAHLALGYSEVERLIHFAKTL